MGQPAEVRDDDRPRDGGRRFSGELVSAEGEPKSALREEGVYSVNKRNELFWNLTLKPGEERKLKYRSSVLVMH